MIMVRRWSLELEQSSLWNQVSIGLSYLYNIASII
uniref:Uncharacterized protein n=1 Tax=Anguilla anguilla TaxID=7936 RepID=A0A0E9RIL2_ANGAN